MEEKGEREDGVAKSEPSYLTQSRKGTSGYALRAFPANLKVDNSFALKADKSIC